jgi:hypothetical protein
MNCETGFRFFPIPERASLFALSSLIGHTGSVSFTF